MQELRRGIVVAAGLAVLALSTPAWAADAPSPEEEKIKHELANWLEGLRGAAGGTRDFVLEQAPHVVREIVAVGRVEYTIWLVGTAILFLICCLVVLWTNRMDFNKLSNDEKTIYALISLFAFLGCVVNFILFVVHIHSCVIAWVAPRLYVLEYLASLIGRATGHGS